MAKYDILIVGGGLGGLFCGNILSREGFNVCVVDRTTSLEDVFRPLSEEDVSLIPGCIT